MKRNLTALCILSAGAQLLIANPALAAPCCRVGAPVRPSNPAATRLAAQDPQGFYTIASDETRELPASVEQEEDPEESVEAVRSEPKSEPRPPSRREGRTSHDPAPVVTGRPSGTPLDEVEVTLDQLIRIGEKVYKIVDQGRPVYNYSLERTNVVPKGIKNWSDLQGWHSPITKRYEREIKNLYGITVVYMRYRIEYTPGGSYNGKGRFLQAISILPEAVEVAWGYTLDVTVSVPAIANAGTSQDPIAAAQVLIDSKISTILKSGEYSESYFVRGDGMFKAL